MPPKTMLDLPEDEKSRERQIAAAKSPPKSEKTGPAKTKSAAREVRLSAALRENLRRRKASGQTPDGTSDDQTGGDNAPGKKTKDD